MQRERERRVDRIVDRLAAARLLDRRLAEQTLPTLRRQLLTQVFFWLPAAIVAAPDRDPAESLDDHARAARAPFLPCCTPAGRRQLESILGDA